MQHLQTELKILHRRGLSDNGKVVAQCLCIDAPQYAHGVGREGAKAGDKSPGTAAVVRHTGPGSADAPDQIFLFNEQRDDLVHGHFVDMKFFRQSAFRRETAAGKIKAFVQAFFQFSEYFIGKIHFLCTFDLFHSLHNIARKICHSNFFALVQLNIGRC